MLATGAIICVLAAVMRLDLRFAGSWMPEVCGRPAFGVLVVRLVRDGGIDAVVDVRFLLGAMVEYFCCCSEDVWILVVGHCRKHG